MDSSITNNITAYDTLPSLSSFSLYLSLLSLSFSLYLSPLFPPPPPPSLPGFMTCVNKEFLPSDRLITTKEAWDRNHTVPPYSITPQPVQFATLSDGGQYPRNTDITLTCAINCFDDNQCPNIYWSFMNSSNITTTDNQFIVNETTLTILQFNDSQQGQYICHTNDSLYSISSYPMELRSPSMYNCNNYY